MSVTAHERGSILLITSQEAVVKSQLPKPLRDGMISVRSLTEAKKYLESNVVKVILSDDVGLFEQMKMLYAEPVRILFVKDLNLNVTEAAINRGEVFRFILNSSSEKEISEAILQAENHFDIVSQHKKLIHNLKGQNQKLESVIQKLESEVTKRTTQLKNIESELHRSKRYLEQLNTLIAWINASQDQIELEKRVDQTLKGMLPVEQVIFLVGENEKMVERIKKIPKFKIVVPLVYQKRNLGHLYLVFDSEKEAEVVYDKMEFIKQMTDTIALTLEKIRIFEMSAKRKAEWEKTFDAIQDPVSLINEAYEIVRANLAYSQKAGLKIQDLSGRKCYEIFQKRKTPCEGCLLTPSLSQKKPLQFDLKSDAQETIYETSVYPLSTATFPSRLSVLYYRDTGEEMNLRHQLIQSEKMAEIGILAGSVAHEINNPLGGILAFSQILLSEIPSTDPIYKDVQEIEKAALRSKSIVENLLFFSRASKEGDRRPLDLRQVIEKALSLVSLKIRHHTIRVLKELQPIPPIFGDFNQMVQVLLNLFQNALEATPKNGEIHIRLTYMKEKQRVGLEFGDSGRGMDSQELTKIFNPFFTTKNKTEHPGLGLSVIYRIIKDHGGEIRAESSIGKGTKFVIEVPIFLKKV